MRLKLKSNTSKIGYKIQLIEVHLINFSYFLKHLMYETAQRLRIAYTLLIKNCLYSTY